MTAGALLFTVSGVRRWSLAGRRPSFVMRIALLGLLAALVAGCGARQKSAPPAPPAPPRENVTLVPDTAPVQLSERRSSGPLTQPQRDSLLREVTLRREAWRARHIENYRIQIAVGCFCPWPGNPAILEVRRGVAVALYDTTGKSLGAPREPWSRYTVDGLFHGVEESVRSVDVLEVAYDPQFGYPAIMRGDGKVGLPDNWFSVRASRLTPLP
jgi:hypothetical protein